MTLEKRGYCKAGLWTPEAVLLYPEAVTQLLREYLRAGADVITTPCFYSNDKKLRVASQNSKEEITLTISDINKAACKIARKVADEGDALVAGSLSPVSSYSKDGDLEKTRKEFRDQMRPFIENDVDFLLGEFFGHVRETEVAIEVMKESDKPIAVSMRIGLLGDEHGPSVEDCAIRMAKAGADIIGINCLFDVNTSLKVLKRMKKALDDAGLGETHIMCQPLGWMCPEVEDTYIGYTALPEAPLCLDARVITRGEVAKFTREAYELGVCYIGGCCGFEPHHIRAISQELSAEREMDPPVNDMCPPHGEFIKLSAFSPMNQRYGRDYWTSVEFGCGRDGCGKTSKLEVGTVKY